MLYTDAGHEHRNDVFYLWVLSVLSLSENIGSTTVNKMEMFVFVCLTILLLINYRLI